MSKFPRFARPNVASIADSVLSAFRRGDAADCEAALRRAERMAQQLSDADEAERMEALCGALSALAGARREQVQAGIYLLEHLAKRPALVSRPALNLALSQTV